jgi:outer membrane protein assembly factor BamB
MRLFPRHLGFCLVAVSLAAAAAEPTLPLPPAPQALLAMAPVAGGLVVHAGARSAALAIGIATSGPWVLALIPADDAAAISMRSEVDQAGLTGQVGILAPLTERTLPFPANSVTILVVDADALGNQAPPAAEIERVLSPEATAHTGRGGEWTTLRKARPDSMDVWGQFHGDAGQNDRNDDGLVGQPRSLQWTGGYNEQNYIGIRTNGRVSVQVERTGRSDADRLTGRNAFNGALLWTSDISLSNRFCLMVDETRVYVLPDGPKEASQPMIALDALTGVEVLRYDQGMHVSRKDYDKGIHPGSEGWPRALLLDGVLVQARGNALYALDAGSGTLLWKHAYPEKDRPAFLSAANSSADGLVIVAEGPGFRANGNYIPGLHLTDLRQVVARDLKTGALRWTWTWPTPPDEARMPFITHLVIGEGRVGLSGMRRDPGKNDEGQGYLLNLDLATGKQIWFREFGSVGMPRHGYFRTYIARGKQWLVRMAVPEPFDLADGTPGTKEWALDFRCHPSRTSRDLAFGALSVTSLSDDRYFFSEAARSACDLGTFPGNGLLYCGPTACGCFAWMPGSNAFSPEAPPGPFAGERLQKGKATAAAAPAVSTWPAPDAWPMHFRDPARSAWVNTTLSATPVIVWTTQLTSSAPSQRLLAREWNSHPLIGGPISSPSLAEGIAVVALTHRQAVIGLDPATGKVRWTTPVDGRVDTAPTIYKGVVLVGTRLGWVYALNRDTGAVVWRFFAAPSGRTLVAHGQTESAWPVFGTVSIIDGLAWVSAGREISMDEGVWWWGLDPLTGAVRKSAQTGFSGEWQRESTLPRDTKAYREAGRFGCATTPPVSDGKALYMQKFGLAIASGERVPGLGLNGSAWKPDQPLVIVPSVFGFASDGELSRGRYGECFLYTDIPAVFHAVDGKRFVSIGCDRPHVGGRQENGGRFLKRWSVGDVRDPKTGWCTELWSMDPGIRPAARVNADNNLGAQGLAVAGDLVIYAVGPKLCAVAYSDGAKRWELPLPAKAVFGGIAVAEGGIVVTCVDGSVVGVR